MKSSRKSQKSDQLLGLYLTPKEKQVLQRALSIHNMYRKHDGLDALSMSSFLREIVMKKAAITILKEKNKASNLRVAE